MTPQSPARRVLHGFIVGCGAFAVLSGCSGGSSGEPQASEQPALRIYHNPYREVNWQLDLRLKGQHHDHTALNVERLRAYDAAGYDAVPLMDYSGFTSPANCLKRRLWPAEAVLPADFVNGLQNIKIWLPNAEEVGAVYVHLTSPFLTRYVERLPASQTTAKEPWQYENAKELISLVRRLGGTPTLAHPWDGRLSEQWGAWIGAVEMYSAYGEARRRQGLPDFVALDPSTALLNYWDRALQINQRVIGVAVNDHFGPVPDMVADADVRDSGKVIVFARAATLADYKEAFDRGAVFAVRDMGVVKDLYPRIDSISVESTSVFVDTDDSVRWISNGHAIASGNLLEFAALPHDTVYVRAEIHNAEGSVVYTQAFEVRPRGDADGDGLVTSEDHVVCSLVASGQETRGDRVDSCRR